jgi:hypothetical protein
MLLRRVDAIVRHHPESDNTPKPCRDIAARGTSSSESSDHYQPTRLNPQQ